MEKPLADIVRLIKAGDHDQARQGLLAYLSEHPDNARAWYLLSLVEPNKQERLSALRRVVELDPANHKAQARLDALQSRRAVSPRLVVLLAALILGIAVIGGILVSSAQPPTNSQLPTLAVLVSPTEATQEVAERPTITRTTEATLSIENSPSPTEAATTSVPTSTPPVTPTAIEPTSQPAPTIIPTAVMLQVLPSAVPLIVPSPSPVPSTLVNPTIAPINPTLAPTAIPPSPTSVPPGDAAPLNIPVNIGSGQMRVISVNRPGEAFIRDLGGSAPNPPANHAWVVVEVLLICASESSCAPTNAMQVIGSSGTAYNPGAGFSLDPPFGASSYLNGQVWGYLGFLIPNNESQLQLVLTEGGTTYRFALQ
jgi:hypothetical protein